MIYVIYLSGVCNVNSTSAAAAVAVVVVVVANAFRCVLLEL